MTSTNLSDRGFVFWPVGNGDSTTLVVDDQLVMQIDLHDMVSADDDGSVVAPVIDRLTDLLPEVNGKPYLAAFALTHGDQDHCGGFSRLLDGDIVVGELWATPRLWRELADREELVGDAKRFHDEALRRVKATLRAVSLGKKPASGDRIRIIGYDDDRKDHDYADLPDEYFTFPGQAISMLDGVDVSDRFEAFVHAPFRDDCAGERNETSLAMQIALRSDDGTEGHLLLLGDLSYVTLKKIFDYSEIHGRQGRLAWEVMLAAHHCSKKVMYEVDAAGKDVLKRDLLDQFERHASSNAYVVASSRRFRTSDSDGDNPPHLLARERYEEIVPNPVICTSEYPSVEDPAPVVFGLTPGTGLELIDPEKVREVSRNAEARKAAGEAPSLLVLLAGLAAGAAAAWLAHKASQRGTPAVRQAVERTRGTDAAPTSTVGFGDM
jgi:hypothetical protein